MLTTNQKRVLWSFQRTGILTLEELRKTSPHWNQAIKVLVNKEFVKRENDGRYSITSEGGGMLAQLQWEEAEAAREVSRAEGNLTAWLAD